MTIWIVRLETERELPLIAKVEDSLRAGRPVALATRFDARAPLEIEPSHGGGTDEVFVEAIAPSPRLLICGAGHIGRAVARVAIELDFDVLVQDERAEWKTAEAFPSLCTFEPNLAAAVTALSKWQGTRFVVLVTRGYLQDVAALNALSHGLQLDYVGLLGSKNRVATVLAAIDAPGAAAWPRDVLHAPIGLEIGAQTPEEIAISIAAEMIRHRHKTRT
jgi:xanthine dehydrogenase accessory factor